MKRGNILYELSNVHSISKLEEAFMVLLDFEDIGAISFENNQLRKSHYKENNRLSRWEVLDKFNYTEEEINDFFNAISIHFPVKHNGATLHFEDGSIHITPNGKGLFVWKDRN